MCLACLSRADLITTLPHRGLLSFTMIVSVHRSASCVYFLAHNLLILLRKYSFSILWPNVCMYVYIRKSCQSIGCVIEACRSSISAFNGYGKSKDPFPRQELRECRRNWKDLLPSDHVCMSIHKRLSPVQLESWGKVSGTVTRGWMWLSAH